MTTENDDLTWSVRRRGSGASQPARLLVVYGASSSMINLPSEGVLQIGRSEEMDLCLADKSVSRHHGRLVIADGEVRIVDLGSYNGILVNGDLLAEDTPCTLVPGDVVVIGEVTLVL